MTIELSELPQRLTELRGRLQAGEEVMLTDRGAELGTIVPRPPTPPGVPQRVGFAKRILDMHPGAFQPTPDFDDPLPDEFWLGDNP